MKYEEKEKGMTLIELVVVIALIGIMSSGIQMGMKWMDRIALRSTARQVVSGIEFAKQAAVASGQRYSVFFLSDRIEVKQILEREKGQGIGQQKTLYKIPLAKNQKILRKRNMQSIEFNGSISTAQSGTIYIANADIEELVRITIDVATSKVRVYYEDYKIT